MTAPLGTPRTLTGKYEIKRNWTLSIFYTPFFLSSILVVVYSTYISELIKQVLSAHGPYQELSYAFAFIIRDSAQAKVDDRCSRGVSY